MFVEVVKAKSFRRAAEAIGIPNSTLSRRISGLEKAIGLRLLHRTTRKIEPTEAGQHYFERCKRIVDEARLAHEQLGELLAQPSGVLRASPPVDFATIFMAPLCMVGLLVATCMIGEESKELKGGSKKAKKAYLV